MRPALPLPMLGFVCAAFGGRVAMAGLLLERSPLLLLSMSLIVCCLVSGLPVNSLIYLSIIIEGQFGQIYHHPPPNHHYLEPKIAEVAWAVAYRPSSQLMLQMGETQRGEISAPAAAGKEGFVGLLADVENNVRSRPALVLEVISGDSIFDDDGVAHHGSTADGHVLFLPGPAQGLKLAAFVGGAPVRVLLKARVGGLQRLQMGLMGSLRGRLRKGGQVGLGDE